MCLGLGTGYQLNTKSMHIINNNNNNNNINNNDNYNDNDDVNDNHNNNNSLCLPNQGDY